MDHWHPLVAYERPCQSLTCSLAELLPPISLVSQIWTVILQSHECFITQLCHVCTSSPGNLKWHSFMAQFSIFREPYPQRQWWNAFMNVQCIKYINFVWLEMHLFARRPLVWLQCFSVPWLCHEMVSGTFCYYIYVLKLHFIRCSSYIARPVPGVCQCQGPLNSI